MRLRPLDWFALCLSIGVCALFAWQVYGAGEGPDFVSVTGPEGAWVYPLGSDTEISVSGPLGETRVVIQGGAAFVLDSPCRDKLCVSMGRVTRHGGWIACLPNRVILSVKTQKDEVDAAAY